MTSKMLLKPDSFGNSPLPARNAKKGTHLIANVHWPQGVKPAEYDGCPIECTCGWSGKVGAWAAHRLGQA